MKRSGDYLTEDYIRLHKDICACKTASRYQKCHYVAVLLLALLLLLFRWDYFVLVTTLYMFIVYGSAAFLRAISAIISFTDGPESLSRDELDRRLEGVDLPMYTILLPLYHESAVTDKILVRIAALDYPKDKLDVILLIEPDDDETRDALAACTLPPYCTVLQIPDGQVRTKPHACNYGLEIAKGQYCVIYDAEDMPEPDQLKKAILAFRTQDTDGHLLCVQAKLNYYNSRQNWLTRFFTVEYSTYFDLTLGGLSKMGIPLPLGGTSNHFKTVELRELGGWDPFNVTEDCDLGIRLYESGYRTILIDSTTWEEANSKLWNWIRQRSRWVKGFVQTHLVHYRHPLSTLRRLGPRGFFGCYLLVGGSVTMMLLNVVLWPLVVFYIVLLVHGACHGVPVMDQIIGPHLGEQLYRGMDFGIFSVRAWPLIYTGPGEDPFLSTMSKILFVGSMYLFLSNFFLIFIHMAACVKRRFYRLLPYAAAMPLYWVLISIGAWKGTIQIITKPFYWEKTIHGLDSSSSAADLTLPPGMIPPAPTK